MTVDLSKIKPGDEVLVRAVVDSVRDFEGGAQLLIKVEDWRRSPNVSVAWNYAGVNLDQIVSHTPKALAVGDRVETHSSTGEGRILAIHAGCAWVGAADDETFPPRTFSLGELERVS